MSLRRRVDPEWLDTLPPDDPRARRARRDLRRVNRLMSTRRLIGPVLDILVRTSFAQSRVSASPLPVIELGSGDGELLLCLGRRYAGRWPPIDLTLLDRQPVVSTRTLDGYRALGWNVRLVRSDVLVWLASPAPGPRAVIFANLFVHHFAGEGLRALLEGAARHAGAFLCCEPRRSRFALQSSRMLGVVGCNDVTRHDAVASVRAGFSSGELSALWPRPNEWLLQEGPAGWFSHRFCARRKPGA